MSLLKRKPSSLDPVQKQRKFRQCEYYALLDKCLQIPNDDKLILRKNVEEQEERLISLLEKYRKQTPKDLKDLQIYLRKYIQKYKIDNPKYPTLKLAKSPSQSYSMHKRNSFSFSINTSKVTIDLGGSTSQLKQSYHIPVKKQVFSPHIKQQKPVLRLNSQMSREQQRNYQELIRKRKTQKLKISQHRVSVTIQNESHSASFYKDLVKNHKMEQKQNNMKKEQDVKEISKTITYEPKMIESTTAQGQISTSQNDKIDKADFLSTMRFRMKVDQNDDHEVQQIQPKTLSVAQVTQALPFSKHHLPFVNTEESIFQTQFDERISTKNDNSEPYSSVKRKLFTNKQNLSGSKVSEKQNLIKSKENSRVRKPMEEINFENTFSSIKKLQEINSGKLPLESSRKYAIENAVCSFEGVNEKQKFNSGHKNSQDSILKELMKSYENQSIIESKILGKNYGNFEKESRIKNEREFKEVESQYMNSQRKMSQLYSHRMADENNRSFMNSFSKELASFSKDKEDKQNKMSSRMIFSHRMQEVISGRKHNDEAEKNIEKGGSVNSSYSFREKKKGANKLQFWARIQSTINE